MARRNELLTAAEVADRLRIHVTGVYRLINNGRLNAHRVGSRSTRISSQELDRFLRESTVVDTTANGHANGSAE